MLPPSGATFVTLEEGVGVPYVPDAPPLLPVLPYDVFAILTTRASSGYSIYVSGGKAVVLSMLASIVCIIFNAY